MKMRTHQEHFNNSFVVDSYRRLYKGNSPVSHLLHIRLARVGELLGKVQGLRILDVGCGIGVIGTHILKEGGIYYGVDFSAEMLKECQRTLKPQSNFFLLQLTMDELSFSNGIFDRVLCLGSLEYAEDLDLVISEISRVLKKVGIAIISMQNSMGLYRLWDRFIHSGSWHNKVRKIRGKPVIEGRPEKIVPLTKLRDEFARHNLMIQKVVYYNFNIFVKPFDRLFPDAAVKVSKRLEFLGRTILGLFLAADFLILAEKI